MSQQRDRVRKSKEEGMEEKKTERHKETGRGRLPFGLTHCICTQDNPLTLSKNTIKKKLKKPCKYGNEQITSHFQQ